MIKKIKNLSGAGFTLIELTIVIAIIAILLGFITINLVRSQQTASLTGTEEVLVADLRQQQLKAMIGDTEGRGTADAYGIHFDSSQYVLFHGATYSSSDTFNFISNLDSNMQFDNPNFNVIFSKLGGEISADSASSIVLRDTTNGNTRTITINRYGVITQVQ